MRPFDRPEPSTRLDPIPRADRLDRAWAATRPAEPSPEVLDALWAHASAELDRIDAARAGTALPLPGPGSPRRRRVAVGLVLAQAAAVLIAAGVAWRRAADQPPRTVQLDDTPAVRVVPRPTGTDLPVATRAVIDVEDDKIMVCRIDGDERRVEQFDQVPLSAAAAGPTARDVYNAIEIAANLNDEAGDGFNKVGGQAVP